jgi:hypothetical protein
MKYAVILIVLLFPVASKANQVNDTIPYWHISYGKLVIIQGNLRSVPKDKHEITVKPDAVNDLIISFVYDNGQPKSSSLAVKEGNETLRTVHQDPVLGPYFKVPVRELIGTHQSNVRYELDFYYTDDRGQQDLKLGTIIFIMK